MQRSKCKVGKSPAKTGGTPLHIWGYRQWACTSRMSQRGWQVYVGFAFFAPILSHFAVHAAMPPITRSGVSWRPACILTRCLTTSCPDCVRSVICAGKDGVGTVFQLAPAIMRCKPTVNDRWDRRVIELAAYLYRHGHCNVPEVCNVADWSRIWLQCRCMPGAVMTSPSPFEVTLATS